MGRACVSHPGGAGDKDWHRHLMSVRCWCMAAGSLYRGFARGIKFVRFDKACIAEHTHLMPRATPRYSDPAAMHQHR